MYKRQKQGDDQIDLALAKRLTFAGHELLDTLRQKTVWEKIKAFGADKVGPLTFDAVIEIGKAVVKEAVVVGITG